METTETAEITAAGMVSRTAEARTEDRRLKARLAGREDRVGLMRHDRRQAARRPLRHSKRAITVGAAAEAMRRPEAIATASQE